jgi:light-regulated signal transduction histidine kinase (bacteriophytochrome)
MRRVLNEEGSGFLKEILKAADRMEGLIDGLLTLSRAGRAEMSCESLDLTRWRARRLRAAPREERDARSSAGGAGINVWGDVRSMMTVLRTCSATPGNTPAAREPAVRCSHEKRDGRDWICVTDNGAGFDMAHADGCSSPSRACIARTNSGHGIGLATVAAS